MTDETYYYRLARKTLKDALLEDATEQITFYIFQAIQMKFFYSILEYNSVLRFH